MEITLHKHDLPADLQFSDAIAVDTETMGLKHLRDPLCLVQISSGDGSAHIVQLERTNYEAPNLKALLGNRDIVKIYHYARFDIAMIAHYLHVHAGPVFCTKIASFLARSYTNQHGLAALCREFLGVEISKQQQSSDWGAATLSKAQLKYAARDVLYLHQLRARLTDILTRERRMDMTQACFDFVLVRAAMDLAGWEDVDIFAHS